MSIIICADAAKLAGLQIDTLQKVRSGQIALEQWERFNNLSCEDREALFGDKKSKPTQRFALLTDLGIITVPKGYNHAIWLSSFSKQNREKFHYYDEDIIDAHYPNPSRILEPGDNIHVRAFKQIVRGTTTSEERMAFLATQNAMHAGAQGATLVFEQKRDQLPKGYWYVSFDEKERLWEDAGGCHKVPCVCARLYGGFNLALGRFEHAWHDLNAFLCFSNE